MHTFKKAALSCLLLLTALILAACASAPAEDLVITKENITETATFFPVKAGKTAMEVFAVRASDGTVRTAFNTCQICYGSGYGNYEQIGDVFQCQNCGNLFSLDQIELERGGCNPVPITGDEKTDDGDSITIPYQTLEDNADYFKNWKAS